MHQAVSSVGELLSILLFLVALVQLLAIAIRAVRKRPLRRAPRILLSIIGLYLLLLFGAGLLSRGDRRLPAGSEKCFDDWCASLAGSTERAAIGERRAHGKFVVLGLRVHNRAERAAFAPSKPRVVVIDGEGRKWERSRDAEERLAAFEGATPPIEARLAAGATAISRLVFEVPASASGLSALLSEGPGALGAFLIDDEQSPFHGRALFPLSADR